MVMSKTIVSMTRTRKTMNAAAAANFSRWRPGPKRSVLTSPSEPRTSG